MRGSVIITDSNRRALSELEENLILDIIRSMMDCTGQYQLYNQANQLVKDKISHAQALFTRWFRTYSQFECLSVQSNLQVNNGILSMPAHQKDFIQAFLFYLTERNIRTLRVLPRINPDELLNFFEFFSKPAKKIVGNKNLPRALKRMGVKRIILSSELVLENVVVRTEISDDLSHRLSRLDVDQLVEKANIISRLDIGALTKVENLASMVTNLHYSKNEEVSNKILQQLSLSLAGGSPERRLDTARTFNQIADKAEDYTLYGLQGKIGSMMSRQAAREQDVAVFSSLAQGMEKAAQAHIARGDYDQAMQIIQSLDRDDGPESEIQTQIARCSERARNNIASPAMLRKLIDDLGNSDRNRREDATAMLIRIGKKAVPEVIDLLFTADSPRTQATVMEILLKIGKPAVGELCTELGEDMNDRFRAIILLLIGQIGDVHCLKRILPFLVHENSHISETAYRAMLNIGGPGAEQKVLDDLSLFDFSGEFFKNRIADMGMFKNKHMVEALVLLLQGKGPFAKYKSPEVRLEAMDALIRIGGPQARDGLSDLLTAKKGLFGLGKGDEYLETAVCNALRRLADPEAKASLEVASRSRSKKVRSAAQQALKALSQMPGGQTHLVSNIPENRSPSTPGQIESAPPRPARPRPPGQSTGVAPTVLDENNKRGMPLFDRSAKPAAENPEKGVAVRLIPTVGAVVLDNLYIRIPGVCDQGVLVDNQNGAEFVLEPGEYRVIIAEETGLEMEKTVRITGDESKVRVDLQDIFNF